MRRTQPSRAIVSMLPWALALMVQEVPPSAALQLEGAKTAAAKPIDLPLAPTRTIKFTADEGTWMSVDVSSDGKTLVFDLLGDLYTLPMAGGHATRLTSGMAMDFQPRFSPDGSQVVFVSDRNGGYGVWTMRVDGSDARAVTPERPYQYLSYRSPIWTTDGTGIVVADGNKLMLYPLGSGEGVALRVECDVLCGLHNLSLSPQGRHLYYALHETAVQARRMNGSDVSRIMRLDRQTGLNEVVVDAPLPRGATSPALSRNGRLLVYATRELDNTTGLKVLDLETGVERWVVRHLPRAAATKAGPTLVGLIPNIVFTPDDRTLVLSYGGNLWRLELATGRATPIPFEAEVEQQLGPLAKFDYPLNDETISVRHIRFPRLSPDGKQLVFGAVGGLWVAGLDNGGLRPLIPADEHPVEPAWSPDGRYIAYTTWHDRTGGAIYRVRADGRGTSERLTRQRAHYRSLVYTPDGSRLVFRMIDPRRAIRCGNRVAPGSQAALAWIAATGGDPRSITAAQEMGASAHGLPHFVGDEHRVYYTAGGGYVEALMSVRLDGSDQRREVRQFERVQEIVLSPRGDRALVLVGDQLHLVTMPSLPHDSLRITEVYKDPGTILRATGAAAVAVRPISKYGADFFGWNAHGDGFFYTLGATVHRYALSAFEREGVAYRPQVTQLRLEVPTLRPEGSIVLRGARVITMRGDEVIEQGDVVVTRNRIAAVGPHGRVSVPKGALEIDVHGKTIIPGWVDLHNHIGGWGPAFCTQDPKFLANLAYGVTAIRDPQSGPHNLSYSDELKAGLRLGPRLFTTGRRVKVVLTQTQARDVVRGYGEYWKTETLKQYYSGDRRARQWIAMAAREFRLTPTNHGDYFMDNLSMVLDGYAGLEHMFGTVPLYRDVVEIVARSRIVWTPTLQNEDIPVGYMAPNRVHYHAIRSNLAKDQKLQRFSDFTPRYMKLLKGPLLWMPDEQYVTPLVAADLAKVVAAGGRVGMGSHGNLAGLGAHWELWDIASGGMPLHDVLRVGTIFGADAIGHANNFGSIEVGKLADLQVLDKNPLEDIHHTLSIRYVMKNGFLYDGQTLDQIWPKTVRLGRQWWQVE